MSDKRGTARFIRRMTEHFVGIASLYRVNPPIDIGWDSDGKTTNYAIVSAVTLPVLWENGDDCETYIFPADSDGNVLSWLEAHGSRKGTLSHREVLKAAGYDNIISERRA